MQNIQTNLQKVKIYLISHIIDCSGAPKVLYKLYGFLTQRGYNVQILAPISSWSEFYKSNQNIFPPIKFVESRDIINTILEECAEVKSYRYLKYKLHTQPIIFCNSLFTNNYVKQILKVEWPVYWIIHEWKDKYMDLINRRCSELFSQVNGMIYVCETSRSSYSCYPQKSSILIYNGIENDKLNKLMRQTRNAIIISKSSDSLNPELSSQNDANILEHDSSKVPEGLEAVTPDKVLEGTQVKKIAKAIYSYRNIEGAARILLDENNVKRNFVVLTMIGTISENKGQDRFIKEVFTPLAAIYKDLRLLLVGTGNIDVDLKIREKVIFQGHVLNVVPYILLSDITICYSNYEVFPLNLMESMCCRKPIVSLKRGGIHEMLIDGVNGYLVNEETEMFARLKTLIRNKKLRIIMGENGKRMIHEKFDSHTNNNEYLSLITTCISVLPYQSTDIDIDDQ